MVDFFLLRWQPGGGEGSRCQKGILEMVIFRQNSDGDPAEAGEDATGLANRRPFIATQ